jgi:hypothetical protein
MVVCTDIKSSTTRQAVRKTKKKESKKCAFAYSSCIVSYIFHIFVENTSITVPFSAEP